MTMEEYFKFLEEYWRLFGPPPAPKAKIKYKLILI